MDKLKLIFLVFLAGVASTEYPEEDGIILLSESNFEQALDDFPQLLVEFFVSWCGHCKKLAPEYAKTAAELKKRGSSLRLAKIDGQVNQAVSDKYGVSGSPTLLWFDNREYIEYTGGKTADEIANWMIKKTGPPAKIISTVTELKQFIENNKIVVVFFGKEDSTEAKTFMKAVNMIEGPEYLISTDSSALTEYEISEPSIVMFKQHDDRRVQFKDDFEVTKIRDFITHNKRMWVMDLGEDAIKWIFDSLNPGLLIFRKEGDHSMYTEMLEKLAPEVKEYIQITVADLSSEKSKRVAEYLGLSTIQMPFGFIVSPMEEGFDKFIHTEALSYDSLKKFVTDWKNKMLHPFMKSEAIPAEPYDNGIRVLVGLNFEEVVHDKNKDVFVEYYAPWCGHCKELAPEYEKAAEMLKNVNSVVLAKIDATMNELKNQSIGSFPTLKFYPSNIKTGIDYQGPRDAKSIVEFIKKHAGIQIDEKVIKTEL